ncbi:MAG: DUF1934 domain-containing protein [Anaeroplasmataceae bacterium]|nr:DUF1934 domain-containing protein [Anaeroplasmataceae bacterium]
MIVSFLSFDDEKNKVFFQTEAIQKENEIWFEDKSCSNTKIKLTLLESSLVLERFGFIEMHLHFDLDKVTIGSFKNEDGVCFDFFVRTIDLSLGKNKFKVKYEMIMDDEILSCHSFQLTFFEKREQNINFKQNYQ